MTLIPISSLSRAERASLGVNILTARRCEHRHHHRGRRRKRMRGIRRAVPPDYVHHAEAA